MALNEIIETLGLSSRPLIICDIDEVVMEFVGPLQDYLESVGHRLYPDSFKLFGNVRRIDDDSCATKESIAEFQEAFFASQDRWQRPARDAKRILDSFRDQADIVFLTAMPPRHHDVRRGLLDLHELPFPMIATEDAKGPVVASLIGERGVRAVFIDDIARNLHSVRTHAPGCLLINLMANDAFRALAPDPGEQVETARNWNHAAELIRAHFTAAPSGLTPP